MSQERAYADADTFFRKEKDKLSAYIRSRITLPDDMSEEDILQDVALNVFSKLDPEQPIRRIASYVYASLRNRIIDLLRSRKASRSVPLDEQRMQDAGPGSGPEPFSHEDPLSEGIGIMYEAMAALSPEQEYVIRETELGGRSFRDISDETGIPVNTLITRKRRGLANLSKEMERIIEEYELPWHPGMLE